MSPRSKVDFRYYRPASENVVSYNGQSKSVLIGKPACFEVFFLGEAKIKCELVP